MFCPIYRVFVPFPKSQKEWQIEGTNLYGRFRGAPMEVKGPIKGNQVWVEYMGSPSHISLLTLATWPSGDLLHTLSTRRMQRLLDLHLERLIGRIQCWDGVTFNFVDS